MEIVFMGTACAAAGRDRDNTSLLLRSEIGSTMIDIGGNPLGKLKRLDMRTDEVARLVLTHGHIDHIYGLPSLLWGMWLDGREKPLDIYCDESDRDWVKSWIGMLGMSEWPARYEVVVRTYAWKQPSVLVSDSDTELSIFPGRHAVPTVGVKLKHQGKVAVYSSDTELNPVIKAMSRIDLLIHEATTASRPLASHSSLREIILYYDWTAVRRLALVHLTDDEPYDEVFAEVPHYIRSRMRLAQDLESELL
ncbi:ribonuclease Z [Paenibacillus sp. 1011MAR3C5]|uniref:MBL fold metallo-hydrolase n=1 Tax=Paenibacillus sp. 1011MAR3C5 TaxID=1675787 RepID=UPI000E6BF92F|nr:ribonuclease Z [Paenibacillus sp. 1011MAR3C5]RJE89981.1 ribonuclease Z [Paenibacillus sp. 1011MAR3C5]